MKIDNSIHSVTNVTTNDGKKNTDAVPKSDIQTDNNTVHISSQATQLQSSNAVVDMGRVQEIKQAISDGTFKVNPENVADRLLETVKELIQSKEGRI